MGMVAAGSIRRHRPPGGVSWPLPRCDPRQGSEGFMSDPSMEDNLRLAHELADIADAVTLSRFGAANLVIDEKPDGSPVTDADTLVEERLRARLRRARPRDAVTGEGGGEARPRLAGGAAAGCRHWRGGRRRRGGRTLALAVGSHRWDGVLRASRGWLGDPHRAGP